MNDIKGIIKDVEKSNLVSNKVIKKVIEIIGQEEWNDLNDAEDDICTTTGELIITLKGIAELEKEISVLLSCKNCSENKGGYICQKEYEDKCLTQKIEYIKELQQENAELKSIAEFQQSSNMNTHFENKKLKEVLTVGSTFNKALNSRNKFLEEETDKYRNMVFDKMEKLTKAKEIIEKLLNAFASNNFFEEEELSAMAEAEQFLEEISE